MKVLLVDDETEFVTALAERFQLRGIDAHYATDGEAALRQIESSPPDVVVLDVLMPGLGGIDVLDRIKKTHPRMPVILVTGRVSEREGPEGIGRGAFDHLTKPIDIDELIARIQDAVNASQI